MGGSFVHLSFSIISIPGPLFFRKLALRFGATWRGPFDGSSISAHRLHQEAWLYPLALAGLVFHASMEIDSVERLTNFTNDDNVAEFSDCFRAHR